MSTRRPAPDTPDQTVQVPAGQAVPATATVVVEPVDATLAEAVPEELSPEAADLVRRLKRVQGQVGGLVRMVEAGRTSSEIITQLSAAEHALHRVGFLLVAEEMRRCARGGADDPEVTARIQAAEKLFLRLG